MESPREVSRRRSREARCFRPTLEHLEDRTLPSATVLQPNDPGLSRQSSTTIGAPTAWAVGTGSSRMVVAVMDTGIDYVHPDLYRNIWINQAEIPRTRRIRLLDLNRNGIIDFDDLNDRRNQGIGRITDLNRNGTIDADDILKPMVKNARGQDIGQGGWADRVSQDRDRYVDDLVGWNFVANNNRPWDDRGHGTHVAGTIGAMGNNGVGVAGINWSVQLMAIKFFDARGFGSIRGFIAGLQYAVAKGARISNNSWTGSGRSATLEAAIAAARARGHIFVAAAGNSGVNIDVRGEYPASFPLDNVVSVAATDRNDRLAWFSNYGSRNVDIAAPGENIYSTNPRAQYGLRSGTSMAAPHVAGALALVWSLRPAWSYRQVIQFVLATANRLPSLKGKVASGRLDLGAAIDVLLGRSVVTWSGAFARVIPLATATSGLRPSEFSSNSIYFDEPRHPSYGAPHFSLARSVPLAWQAPRWIPSETPRDLVGPATGSQEGAALPLDLRDQLFSTPGFVDPFAVDRGLAAQILASKDDVKEFADPWKAIYEPEPDLEEESLAGTCLV